MIEDVIVKINEITEELVALNANDIPPTYEQLQSLVVEAYHYGIEQATNN
jgi:hypothetical protein